MSWHLFPFFRYFLVLFGRPPALLGHPLGSSGVSLAFSWCPFGCLWLVWAVFGIFLVFFCDKGPQGENTLSPALCFLYVFFVLGVVFSCFSRCFLTRKRGRGGAAGAAEDHSSIQHSLETIALQPFFFLVVQGKVLLLCF